MKGRITITSCKILPSFYSILFTLSMAMVNEQPSLGQFHALIVGLGNKSASFLIHLVRLLETRYQNISGNGQLFVVK